MRDPIDRWSSWFYHLAMMQLMFRAKVLAHRRTFTPDPRCRCTRGADNRVGFDSCMKLWMANGCPLTFDGNEDNMRGKEGVVRMQMHEAPAAQWRHFCGWEHDCTVDDAIRNMEQGFKVVGLTEE